MTPERKKNEVRSFWYRNFPVIVYGKGKVYNMITEERKMLLHCFFAGTPDVYREVVQKKENK